ncbi:hypothetical protein ACPA0F_18460 [Solibacillus silvestris]
MESSYELVEDNIFAKKISENEYGFIEVSELDGDEDFKYVVYGLKVDYRWNTPQEYMEFCGLTEAEANYPFAACLYIFKETLELGNEEWNRLFKTMRSVKTFLLEEYTIEYDKLKEE